MSAKHAEITRRDDAGGRPASRRHSRLVYRLLRAVALLATASLLASCSRSAMEPIPPLPRRVAVLDFKVSPDIAKTHSQIRGWWLGARTIDQNPNVGRLFADALARRLAKLDYIEQRSRSDLKYYMASKLKRLRSSFLDLGLTDADFKKMLDEVSPVDYGEDLGVEQVLTGRVIEAYTSTHRTFRTWHSFVRVEVDVWGVTTGQIVWTEVFSEKKRFYSQSEVMDRLAPKIVKALDKNYYQLQN